MVGLFGIVVISKREFLRDGLIMIGSAAVLFLMGMDGQLSMMDGLILVIIYVFYFMTVVREEKVFEKIRRRNNKGIGVFMWSIVSVIAGFAFLIFASKLVVECSQ